MSGDDLSVDDLKKRLLGLKKKRKKLENSIEQLTEEMYLPLDNAEKDMDSELIVAEDKLKYYERMGVQVTLNKSEGKKCYCVSYLNWFDRKVEQTFHVNIIETKKGFSIVEHDVPENVCPELNQPLPIKKSKEDGKLLLAVINKTIKAFFCRKNQFEELARKYPEQRCVWQTSCKSIEFYEYVPLPDINAEMLITLNYRDQEILPHLQEVEIFKKELPDGIKEEVETKLGDYFQTKFLIDAYEDIFNKPDDGGSSAEDTD